jgi:hypothetical protein
MSTNQDQVPSTDKQPTVACNLCGQLKDQMYARAYSEGVREMNNQEALWTNLKTPGMEHLYLVEVDDWLWADGLILYSGRQSPHRVRYFIRFDQQRRVRNIRLDVAGFHSWSVEKIVNDDWQWMQYYSEPEQELSGCRAFDISFSLTTKSLALRQLSLSPGEMDELQIAYLDETDFRIKSVQCRVTCMEKNEEQSLYRYENLFDGSTHLLQLDQNGLLVNSSKVLERLWPV